MSDIENMLEGLTTVAQNGEFALELIEAAKSLSADPGIQAAALITAGMLIVEWNAGVKNAYPVLLNLIGPTVMNWQKEAQEETLQ